MHISPMLWNAKYSNCEGHSQAFPIQNPNTETVKAIHDCYVCVLEQGSRETRLHLCTCLHPLLALVLLIAFSLPTLYLHTEMVVVVVLVVKIWEGGYMHERFWIRRLKLFNIAFTTL